MIEYIFILLVAFGILILFYRQAMNEYNILQIEMEQVSDLPKLLGEQTPVVVRGIGAPKLFTEDSLKSNARLLSYPVTTTLTIQDYIQNPQVQIKMPRKSSKVLANESGLQVWASHTWFPKVFAYSAFEMIHTIQAEACLGEKGLQKTTAIYTLLYPTSGALDVTLLTENQGTYMPSVWRGRFPETFTLQDGPLVGEMKYITIKLRPGNILWIPTHWYLSIRSSEKKACFWSLIEIHNPVSWLATSMETSLDQ